MGFNGLYRSEFEHDACGIGAVVNIEGLKSHKNLEDALNILSNLEHRGGTGADGKTGDGAGVLFQIPHRFFVSIAQEKGVILPKEGDYGVGMLFLPVNSEARDLAIRVFTQALLNKGIEVLFWREVPSDDNILGESALKVKPYITQVVVKKIDKTLNIKEFNRILYLTRREFEKKINSYSELQNEIVYVASLSASTIVYKGMLKSNQIKRFYIDLDNPKVETAIAMVHSRYSTNTFPSWERAHPNRYIIHNGEINTLRGNVNKLYSREGAFEEDIKESLPIINKEGSDSAILDNTIEFMINNGRSLPRAIMMLVPEPYKKDRRMSKEKKAFYEYNGTLMEPWDGPAAIVFTDGVLMGAVLDRNGLRPGRYYITKDNNVVLSSEVGALDIKESEIIYKGRLEPGKMFLVNTDEKRIIHDEEIKEKYSRENNYIDWLKNNLILLDQLEPVQAIDSLNKDQREKLMKTYGYSYEDLKNTILPMCENGEEPLSSMGVDTPLAILSDRPQLLFDYFKQSFAQVTNPPIDAIREEFVTDSTVFLGTEGNILQDKEENCRQIRLDSPILIDKEFDKIISINTKGFKVGVVDLVYNKNKISIEKALENLYYETYKLIENGTNLIVLSDKNVTDTNMPIPSLLATSALHHYLVNIGKRNSVDLIVETGDAREIHHFAALVGFGASAIYPYLAYEGIRILKDINLLEKNYEDAVNKYRKASVKGLVKVLSKMGISTVQSYQGSQLFEALGIDNTVIDKYFQNTVSRIGGIGINQIEEEVRVRHTAAFKKNKIIADFQLESNGKDTLRTGKEEHLYNPLSIHLLQESTKKGDYSKFKEYTSLMNNEKKIMNLRALLDFEYSSTPLDIEEVESVDSIVKRFKTGAMSYGSISKEAHEALAIAMNRIGGKSNTGEGGEDKERWTLTKNGDLKRSSIKQIASGRFGVTSEYLVNADELQIKMAQGAKPGEGGQLPGYKVYPWIAKTRGAIPGVGLISPPPHHDIYSIEDLAQLIYDLKNANRKAKISVKLVSEAGVGTVATGVAKAGANCILISGYDGGTGASPKTSIKHAGLPWELGLVETHQTLILNGLRDRVTVETDGKLMTGRDVAIAALLGAEEFGFATAPLVTLGCVMMRVCDLDTCPMGIATQNEELRKRFKGKPEYVVNFMRFIAEELREYMAKLGFRTVEDMVGRIDKLKQKKDVKSNKGKLVDLSLLLENTDFKLNSKKDIPYNLDKVIDNTLLIPYINKNFSYDKNLSISINIDNTNRTLGTLLGSELTGNYDNSYIRDNQIVINCHGSGGQSFGAFIPKGLTLNLVGDANDYIGKGLSGGRIIVKVPDNRFIIENENIIIGNVALYGATSGKLFVNGRAGERFAVRNSGAVAVVEGIGAHGCEYMTGGRVIILGEVGINFSAGMSGGIAYIYEGLRYRNNINEEMVDIEALSMEDKEFIDNILQEYNKETDSTLGKKVLMNLDKFIKIMPKEYKRVLGGESLG